MAACIQHVVTISTRFIREYIFVYGDLRHHAQCACSKGNDGKQFTYKSLTNDLGFLIKITYLTIF